jgi:hypothetical protein
MGKKLYTVTVCRVHIKKKWFEALRLERRSQYLTVLEREQCQANMDDDADDGDKHVR